MLTTKLKNLVPFYKKYVAAMSRVAALEMAFSVMLESPRFVASETVGFNAQLQRKRVFQDLLAEFGFEIFVETGTFIGDTTGYLAVTTKAKIFTCEANAIFHALAKSRLAELSNIAFTRGDSREFLRSLIGSELSLAQTLKPVFFYLDAHWHEDLPLGDEVDIIAKSVKEFVIMVDDFQVPGDQGYRYDNYGRNKSLDSDTFADCFRRANLSVFYPSAPASQETGGKTGCVILTRRGSLSDKLQRLTSLRSAPVNRQA